ncbi:TetR family transcriptional regulator C-terminal domain-containing protein [Streptomyces sp. NPDC049916]|uniref:TetR/AcrR family transcriptional regulator n=1 Tax=unclassified Streptomyces TaxID=2593676 RepID=UPI00341A2658
MPRKVDHRARRELLADALMRLAATQGLDGVSLRHVAAEAGVSTGMVQHYFRTKDEMMTFAFTMVEDRIRARCETAEAPDAPRDLVRALLLQILPLDDTRRLEGHVGLAFLAYAAVKPAIQAGVREDAGRMRGFIAEQLRAAGTKGVDPDRAATGLLALVDGLGIHLLSRQYTERDAVAALDAQLDLIFDAR